MNDLAGGKHWACEAITDENADFAKSIKNLKIIYATVLVGSDALKNLKNGILESIKMIVTNPETKVNEEEKCRQLMGYLNALLITETLGCVDFIPNRSSGLGIASAEELEFLKVKSEVEKQELYNKIYNEGLAFAASAIFSHLGDELDKFEKLLEESIKVYGLREISENCSRYTLERKRIDRTESKVNKLLFKCMQHDYDSYLRQIGIIDSLGDKESVAQSESELSNVENELLENMGKHGEVTQYRVRLKEVSKIVKSIQQKNKFKNDVEIVTKGWKQVSFNGESLLRGNEKLFDVNRYDEKYLKLVVYPEVWSVQNGIKKRLGKNSFFRTACTALTEKTKSIVKDELDIDSAGLFFNGIKDAGIRPLLSDYLNDLRSGLEKFKLLGLDAEVINKEWIEKFAQYWLEILKIFINTMIDEIPYLEAFFDNKQIGKMISSLILYNYNFDDTIHYISYYHDNSFLAHEKNKNAWHWALLQMCVSMKIRLVNCRSSLEEDRFNKVEPDWTKIEDHFVLEVLARIKDMILDTKTAVLDLDKYEDMFVKRYIRLITLGREFKGNLDDIIDKIRFKA